MPVFNDSEGFVLQPEGDYVFRVEDFEIGISKGSKTRGSEAYSVELVIEDAKGKSVGKVYETLVDHESIAWKLDTFLKSTDVKLAKGEPFEFREDTARASGVKWVNPLGLRGWCRLTVEEYEGKKRNKIGSFYTDRQKLPRAEVQPKDESDIPF